MTVNVKDFEIYLKYARNGSIPKDELRAYNKPLTKSVQKEINKWKVANNHNEKKKASFQVIDFFCGCGGMSLGFAALSRVIPIIDMIGGCDIDKDALATYETNFGAPGLKIDIRDLVEDEIALKDFLNGIPNYDHKRKTILIGCAPCQGFTSHRKRHWHKDDHRNTLVGAFSSIAVQMNPDCIIMENVPEILSRKYWNHFIDAQSILKEAGYQVSQTIYNAASFGVPQDRFRAIIIAMKKSFLLPTPIIDSPNRYKTVKDAIGKLPPVDPGRAHENDQFHRSALHRKSTIETIKAVPKDGGSRPVGVGPKCLDRVKGFYDVYGRLAWNRPAITITHYARNPASGRYIHPEQDRGLTIREAALLQSFPKGFQFSGTFDSIFKQIGEAVPPLFSAAVAVNCITELLSPPPTVDQLSNGIKAVTEPVSSSYSSVIAGMKLARNKR